MEKKKCTSKPCALRAQYWRFAPIINCFGGPQMCTMSRSWLKVYICGVFSMGKIIRSTRTFVFFYTDKS